MTPDLPLVETTLPTALLVVLLPVVLVLALTGKPYRLLLLGVLTAVLPDNDWLVGGVRVDPDDLVLAGIAISLLLVPAQRRRLADVPYLWLWLVLGVLLSISYLTVPLNAPNLTDPLRIVYQLYRYCWKPIAYYPLGFMLITADAKARAALVYTIIVVGMIVAVHASIQGYGLEDPRAFFSGGNSMGGALLVPFVLAVAGTLARGSRRRVALHVLAALAIARGIVFANSRGAAVATAAAIVVFLGLMLVWRWGRRPALRTIAAGALAVVALFVAKPDLLDRPNVKHLLTALQGTSDENFQWRAQQRWPVFLEMIREHPWVGVGTNRDLDLSEAANTPHNGYLSVAVTYGVPAALLVTLFMVAGVRNGIRLARRAARKGAPPRERIFGLAVAGALSGVLVHNIVESTFMVPFVFCVSWLLTSVAAETAVRHRVPVTVPRRVAHARPPRRRALRPAVGRGFAR